MPCLRVGNVGHSVTDRDLASMCDRFGEVQNCVVHRDQGIGFVHFSNWAGAERALEQAPTTRLGSMVSLAWEQPRNGSMAGPDACLGQGLDATRLFVGGLEVSATNTDLKSYFERFGVVTGASVIPGKRVGFVNFEMWGPAKDAQERADRQRTHFSKGLTVSFAKAKGS